MRAQRAWLTIAGVVGTLTAGFWWQAHEQAQLRQEITALLVKAAVLAQLREENQRLLAAKVMPGELADLRSDRLAVAKVRTELEALRAQPARHTRTDPAPLALSPEDRFSAGSKMPTAEWKDVGAATSKAALETALWAAAGGDIDRFAKGMVLFGGSEKPANRLLAGLPEATRQQYSTPERLIAALTIKDVPLGGAEVRKWTVLQGWPSPAQQVELVLSSTDGKKRYVDLLLMMQGGDWKLVVTSGVVAKYAAALRSGGEKNE